MHFAYLRSPISGVAYVSYMIWELRVTGQVICPESMLCDWQSAHKRLAGRHADRRIAGASAEGNAVARESVQVWRFDDRISGETDRISTLLVRKNKDDIGSFGQVCSLVKLRAGGRVV
tara:strand:- start:2258 stop:2611 length:354 start_codon:yes stop_codon:yes gene_type:complete